MNRVEAEQRPKKYLSLIVDGMDQAKTNIPHFTGIYNIYLKYQNNKGKRLSLNKNENYDKQFETKLIA